MKGRARINKKKDWEPQMLWSIGALINFKEIHQMMRLWKTKKFFPLV